MSTETEIRGVISEYPAECRPHRTEPLGCAGGFSGARFWRLHTPSGGLCLRRWPKKSPSLEQLQFIQATLWHVTREGFELVPLPRETRTHAGYVRKGGYFWELAPWLTGEADFHERPSTRRLRAALKTLAEFHRSAESFPIPHRQPARSPGIRSRLEQLQRWVAGDLARLAQSFRPGIWPELEHRAAEILGLAPVAAGGILSGLSGASRLAVPLQVCIGDIWHGHVLYVGDRVTGLVDFGSVRTDNVAADIARLLGSMAGDDAALWHEGLMAYEAVRPLSGSEYPLIEAFDESTVLMAGLNWINWIYRERRTFEASGLIPGRLDSTIVRLHHLCQNAGRLK